MKTYETVTLNEPSFKLRRCLISNPNMFLITKRLNEIYQTHPEERSAILTIILFPALRWVLRNEHVVNNIYAVAEEQQQAKQNIAPAWDGLLSISHDVPSFIEHRKAFFANCKVAEKNIADLLFILSNAPWLSEDSRRLMDMLLEKNNVTLSRYTLNKIVSGFVEDLAMMVGQEPSWLTSLTTSNPLDNANLPTVYEQALAIMKYYGKLSWIVTQMPLPANEEKMVKSAVNNMTQVFDSLAEFPGIGPLLKPMVTALTDCHYSDWSDEDIAATLGISTYTFSVYKRKVLLVFHTIFIAENFDGVLRLLTDKA